MLTITIWFTHLSAFLLITGAAVAWAARRAGSPRGRLWVGVRVIGLLTLLNVAGGLAVMALPDSMKPPPLVEFGFLLLIQIGLTVAILGRTFQLPGARPLLPVAVYLVADVIWIVFLLLVVRRSMTEAFVLPTESMAPTIQKDDRFFANKLLAPRRWDLVVYWADEIRGQRPVTYCKRLVGLPGERLRFDGGQIHVNGVMQTAPAVVAGRYHATLPHGRSSEFAGYRDGEEFQLGPTEYFFIGDNVDLSGDSRLQGPTDVSRLVGVVDVIYWPLSRFTVVR